MFMPGAGRSSIFSPISILWIEIAASWPCAAAQMMFLGPNAASPPKNTLGWVLCSVLSLSLGRPHLSISIHKMLIGEDVAERPAPGVNIVSQKMGIHEWSYDNAPTIDHRLKVPHRAKQEALKDIMAEVELGFDPQLAFKEAQRCLNCDVQTVFTGTLCIECDACVDICPMNCISFTENAEEKDLRARLMAPALNPAQDLYIGNDLKTGRVMVKDEDVCLHCGLCAERCPTGAWDMRKYYVEMTNAEHACRQH